ncbi:hypothetical protein G6F40_014405 [Rhizopus arrhizus]|nr:hypothetical protein G6F40_014405 [Rhizopus arrhizus]
MLSTSRWIARIGGGKAGEQLVQRAILGIGLRGQQVAATGLGLQVEGQAAIAEHIIVALASGQVLSCPAGLVLLHGDVGQADTEQVLATDIDLQRARDGRCIRPLDTHIEGVVADRHQVFGGELAILVQWVAVAVDLQRGPQR